MDRVKERPADFQQLADSYIQTENTRAPFRFSNQLKVQIITIQGKRNGSEVSFCQHLQLSATLFPALGSKSIRQVTPAHLQALPGFTTTLFFITFTK